MTRVTRIAGIVLVALGAITGCGDDAPPSSAPGTGATAGAHGGIGAAGEAEAGIGGSTGGTEAGVGAAGGDEAGLGGSAGETEAGMGGAEAGMGGSTGGTGTNTTGGVGGSENGGSGWGGEHAGTSGLGGAAGAEGSGANGGSSGSSDGGSGGGSAGVAGSGGTAGTVEPGPECAPGEMQVCEVTPGNRGGCFQSVRLCNGDTWGSCRPMPGERTPGGEACNGEDEDCDGEIDEDLGEVSCGLGACRNTVPACTKGVLGSCQPLEPQTSTDACNGIDDDCDGAVDEDCRDCVHVAPDGDDAAALASDGATPFRDVQRAIDFAAASGAERVCVAAGATCGASTTFPGPAASELTMQDGVSVLAGYESTTWARCSDSMTTLAPATGAGVYFPASIARPTALDGFTITSAPGATTAGVTVEGGRGVTLSNLNIQSSSAATNSYGANVTNGADVRIVRSRIVVTSGTEETVGLRVVGSRVQLEDNCTAMDATTGRCSGDCAIRASSNATVVLGVALDDAPGSRLERSHACAESVDPREFDARLVTTQAVRIQGDGTGVVLRENTIATTPFYDGYGDAVELTDCGGAAPWIVENTIKVTPRAAPRTVRGVSAAGDCHPVIESSTLTAGLYYSVSDRGEVSAVVHCGSAGGTGSRCVIAGNDIAGVGGGNQTTTWQLIGINCAGGGCSKISRNTVVGRKHEDWSVCTVNCNADPMTLRIRSSGPFVDRNRFSLGCVSSGVVISMTDSWSRFQNNIVVGKEGCPLGTYVRHNWERLLEVGAPQQELDIHSNSFQGGRAYPRCASTEMGIGWTGSTTAGTFRNNFVSFDQCYGAVLFAEANAASDPAVLENNALNGARARALYVNEGVTSITSIADVNAMSDIVCSGNIIGSGSVPSEQWDRGTPSGAPLWDFSGNPRDDTPSIGATER